MQVDWGLGMRQGMRWWLVHGLVYLVALPLAVRSGRLGGGAPGGEGDGGLFICFSGASFRDTLPHSVPAHRYSSINTYNSVERSKHDHASRPFRRGPAKSADRVRFISRPHRCSQQARRHLSCTSMRSVQMLPAIPLPFTFALPTPDAPRLHEARARHPPPLAWRRAEPSRQARWLGGLSADAWALTQHLVRLPPDLLQHAAHLVSRL